MMKKLKTYDIYLIVLIILFIISVWLIIKGHTNIGFWYQSDNLFIPHFVHDVFVEHHSITDWCFAAGTTQLLSLFPHIIFSLVTSNVRTWMVGNALFLLTSYFLLFVILGKMLFCSWRTALFLPLSSLLSLAILADFKEIPFTLDSLLIAGQHEMSMMLTLCGLMLVLIQLKNPQNKWVWYVLFVSVFLELVSDEIFLLAFVIPIISILGILCLKIRRLPQIKSEIFSNILSIICVLIMAAFLAKLVYQYAPLSYARQGPVIILTKVRVFFHDPNMLRLTHSYAYDVNFFNIIHACYSYFCIMFSSYPVYMTMLFLFFPTAVITLLFYLRDNLSLLHNPMFSNKNLQVIVIMFIVVEWLGGLLRPYLNYHTIQFFLAFKFNSRYILSFLVHALTCSDIDFFIIPIFLGWPVLIGFFLSYFKEKNNRILCNICSVIGVCLIGALLIHAIHKIHKVTTYKTQMNNMEQLIQCMHINIKRHALHAGVADYWDYRAIALFSHGQVNISPVSSAPGAEYEHYLSSWAEIYNKNLDYWVARYDKIFKDPAYANYYDISLDISDKLKYFGPPNGQFICRAADGTWLQVYFYRHHQIMRHLLRSIRSEGKPHAYINTQNQISW